MAYRLSYQDAVKRGDREFADWCVSDLDEWVAKQAASGLAPTSRYRKGDRLSVTELGWGVGVIATCSPKRVCGNINQTPKLYAIAVRVGYPAAAVIDMFKKWQLRPLMQKNFHLHDNVHGVEKLGAMEFIQSMFIQCDHGIVKVFPNWTGADAKFENLRAKGCFLVSAEMKNGKVVRVSVKSEKGGRFRLVDPFGRGTRPACPPPSGWTRGKTRNSSEPTLERDFKPGCPREPQTTDCFAGKN